ncbi:MAG: type II secretion system protein [Sedimentisphaeraceae bacterium JB056]
MRKRAFTLIELLVVISIIAVLMSIMMPALSKARTQARIVICGSNIKNLSQAAMMYLQENDQYYPGMHNGTDNKYNDGNDSLWDDKLYVYLENYEVFSCAEKISHNRAAAKITESYIGPIEGWDKVQAYGFNTWLQGWTPNGITKGTWPDSHASSINPKPLKASNVKSGSSVVMLSDTGAPLANDGDSFPHFSYFYSGGIRFMPDLVPAHEVRLNKSKPKITFHNRYEMSGGISLGFADGHIEKITRFDYTADTVKDYTPPKEGLKINPNGRDIR